jgi:hypothetical protein
MAKFFDDENHLVGFKSKIEQDALVSLGVYSNKCQISRQLTDD